MKRLYIFITLGLLSAVLATAVIASAMNSRGLSASEMVESLKQALVPEEEAKEEAVAQAPQEATLENLTPARERDKSVRQAAPRSWNFGLTQVAFNEDELPRTNDDALLDVFSLPGQLAEFGQLSVPDIQSLGENVVSFDNLRVAYSVPQRTSVFGFDGDPGGPSDDSTALNEPIISGGKTTVAVADDQNNDDGTGDGTGTGTGDGVTGDTGDQDGQSGDGGQEQGQEDPLGSPENPIPNPEPGTLALTAIGAGMALLVARRRSR